MRNITLNDRTLLRSFLLGKTISETEIEEVELKLFMDKYYYEKILIVEEELIEEYIFNVEGKNKIDSSLEKFINMSKERREKVKFIQALINICRDNADIYSESAKEVSKENRFTATIQTILSILKGIKNLKLERVNY